MPDPITTVVTVVSEHPQAAAAVVSIYGVVKPFLAKILGPGAEEIGEIGRNYIKGRRAKNAERTLADADKLLAEAGREPQEVPLDVAVPLLEAASLQEEPSMTELWAALLANAADPAQQAPVQTAFVSILRDLTAPEAKLLQLVADATREGGGYVANKFIATIGLFTTMPDFALLVDKLTRATLCVSVGNSEPLEGYHPFVNSVRPGKDTIAITDLGLAFLAAVTPPTP